MCAALCALQYDEHLHNIWNLVTPWYHQKFQSCFAASGSAIQGFHFPITVQRTYAGSYCHVPVLLPYTTIANASNSLLVHMQWGYSRVQSPEGSATFNPNFTCSTRIRTMVQTHGHQASKVGGDEGLEHSWQSYHCHPMLLHTRRCFNCRIALVHEGLHTSNLPL